MNRYRVTVNGTVYEVDIEEIDGEPQAVAAHAVASPAAVSPTSEPAKKAPVPRPAPAVSAPPASAPPSTTSGAGDILAPIPGTVISVAVAEGQSVSKGQLLVTFEAMKMENEVMAPRDGVVTKVYVGPGSRLEMDTPLVELS